MIKKVFLIIAATVALSGCVDRVSTLGSAYYADTVGFYTITRSDAGFFQLRDTARPFVTYQGLSYNITNYSPLMIIGRVAPGTPAGNNESLESWGLLKFYPISTLDSLKLIVKVRLLLKDLNYSYGDASSNNVDFQVWTETNNKVSDSTTSLSQSDLTASVGTIDSAFADTTDHVLPILLDTSVISELTASSFALVVTPKQIMTNARAFGTSDNGGNDANSVPQLECTLNNGAIIYLNPILDEQLVKDMSPSLTSMNEFTLRGGTGARERITFDLSRPGDTAKLTQFTTINSAVLILHLDPNNSRESNLSFDTSGPAIVQITGVGDTATSLIGFGYHNAADTTIRFQIRGLIEDWLRSPTSNFGLELRSGFVTRLVPGSGGVNIGLEDNTLNRWTFYGQNYSDPSKHPQLILTYSNLH